MKTSYFGNDEFEISQDHEYEDFEADEDNYTGRTADIFGEVVPDPIPANKTRNVMDDSEVDANNASSPFVPFGNVSLI